jgi:hypothetical protein
MPYVTRFYGLERRDRVDELGCGHNGTSVVWMSRAGVHLLIRVIRSRVFYHRDLVAKSAAKRTVGSMQVCAMSPMTMS